MNERIKELMNQTGVPVSMPFDKWCEKFAELIRADEREACAKVCDKYAEANQESDIMCTAFDHCAKAIRARGETK